MKLIIYISLSIIVLSTLLSLSGIFGYKLVTPRTCFILTGIGLTMAMIGIILKGDY